MSSYPGKSQGFTLVELIIVIVIMGIIAITSSQFIVNTVKGFNNVSLRDKQANSLRISLAKIERQLLSGHPESVRVRSDEQSQCLEMLAIDSSHFYISPASTAETKIQIIDLEKPTVGMMVLTDQNHKPTGNRSSIYKTALNSKVLSQTKQSPNKLSVIRLANTQSFTPSATAPVAHFISQAISYCIEGDKLYRYRDYPIRSVQPLAKSLPQAEPQKVLLQQGLLSTSNFNFSEDTQLLEIQLEGTVALAGNSEKIALYQQWRLLDE